MCDTLCALPTWSASGHTLIGKNSDRDPNEPHVIRRIPAQTHEKGSRVRCTYIEIPQVASTYDVLLLKPDWIWGAEMGVNEHGVAIGNEAVFTRAKKEKDGLIGMDLLRLALERADSAEAALKVIVDLLAEYGQGGNCGYSHDFRYDNSFLIADPDSAFVLETAGRAYAAVPVARTAAISNRLSIGDKHTLRRNVDEGSDFARSKTEPIFSHFAQSAGRRAQCLAALENDPKPISVGKMIAILRSHNPKTEGREFTRSSVGSVCMHGGGLIGDHTTGSFVAILRRDAPITVWATGASTPCISAFKPIFFGRTTKTLQHGRVSASDGERSTTSLVSTSGYFSDYFCTGAPVHDSDDEGRAYWLERERLHRAVLAGLVDVESLRARRDSLEAKWQAEEARLFAGADVTPGQPNTSIARPHESPAQLNELPPKPPILSERLHDFAARAAAEEQAMVNEFSSDRWSEMPGRGYFASYWRKKNANLGAKRP